MGTYNKPIPDDSASLQEKQNYILERMRSDRLIYSSEIHGVSTGQIIDVERRFEIEFPPLYRWFLENLSESHGSLSMEISVSLAECIQINEEYRKIFADSSHDSEMFGLPQKAWIVSHRYGQQFQFIDCSRKGDSPVWYCNDWSIESKIISTSIFIWLIDMMECCETTVKRGRKRM